MSAPCKDCGMDRSEGPRPEPSGFMTLNCGRCGQTIQAFGRDGEVKFAREDLTGMDGLMAFLSGYIAGSFVKRFVK